MASRRQQAASSLQPAGPRAQGADLLPDDVLVKILSALNVQERLQSAALVCRRWHACAHVPELCRDLVVEINPTDPEQEPAQLASLSAWLRRHGQPLRRLSLLLLPFEWVDGVLEQLAQCMSEAAATMPQLQQLLVSHTWLEVSWAGQLPPSLRELSLHSRVMERWLLITSSLSHLTQLTKLLVRADFLRIDEGVQFPASIRTLALQGNDERGVSQLLTLAHLDTLVFEEELNLDGLDAWAAQMSGLTFLELHISWWPDCLNDLTNLQHLALEVDEAVDEPLFFEDVDAGLRCLTGLTALLLRVDYPREGSVPPALAQLSRLQRLCFLALDKPVLLPGPYSASLRVLGASCECLNRSTALLASSGSLEHVAALRDDCSPRDPFWQWAAQHPSLRRLQLAAYGFEWYKREQKARLREARPEVEVERIDERSFLSLFKWQDPAWSTLELVEEPFRFRYGDASVCAFSVCLAMHRAASSVPV